MSISAMISASGFPRFRILAMGLVFNLSFARVRALVASSGSVLVAQTVSRDQSDPNAEESDCPKSTVEAA